MQRSFPTSRWNDPSTHGYATLCGALTVQCGSKILVLQSLLDSCPCRSDWLRDCQNRISSGKHVKGDGFLALFLCETEKNFKKIFGCLVYLSDWWGVKSFRLSSLPDCGWFWKVPIFFSLQSHPTAYTFIQAKPVGFWKARSFLWPVL